MQLNGHAILWVAAGELTALRRTCVNNNYLAVLGVALGLEGDVAVLSKQLQRSMARFARLAASGDYVIPEDAQTEGFTPHSRRR